MATAATTIRVRIEPELSPEFTALLGTATEDALEKLAAATELVYALYHCPAEVVLALPQHVVRANARAQAAFAVRRSRQPSIAAAQIETEETTGA